MQAFNKFNRNTVTCKIQRKKLRSKTGYNEENAKQEQKKIKRAKKQIDKR